MICILRRRRLLRESWMELTWTMILCAFISISKYMARKKSTCQKTLFKHSPVESQFGVSLYVQWAFCLSVSFFLVAFICDGVKCQQPERNLATNKTICCSYTRKKLKLFFGLSGTDKKVKTRTLRGMLHDTWGELCALTIKKARLEFQDHVLCSFSSASVISRFKSHKSLVFVLASQKTPPKETPLKSEYKKCIYVSLWILISKFIAVTWHRSMTIRLRSDIERHYNAKWSVEKREGRKISLFIQLSDFYCSPSSTISDENSWFSFHCETDSINFIYIVTQISMLQDVSIFFSEKFSDCFTAPEHSLTQTCAWYQKIYVNKFSFPLSLFHEITIQILCDIMTHSRRFINLKIPHNCHSHPCRLFFKVVDKMRKFKPARMLETPGEG